MSRHSASNDPWEIEERADPGSAMRRPDLSEVPRIALYGLGLLAAVRAAGLVLIAEAVARGISAIAAGGLAADAVRLVLVLGFAGAVLRAGGEWAASVLARRVASGVKTRLRRRLWRRIAEGDAGGGGSAVLASDGLDDLDDYFIQTVPAVISAAVVPLIAGIRILGADWVSAVVIVLTIPLVPLFMILIGRHTQQRTDAALSALTRLADHLAELARGLPVLVGLGRVAEQTAALDGVQTRYRERTEQTLRWAFLSALALELIATISVALVAVLLGLRLLDGTMQLEPALIALILAPECFTALREVGTAFHASQDGLSALDRVRALLSARRGRDARTSDAAAVRLVGVGVAYAGREHPAVRGVSAALDGIVAIEGPSGAGKSTLLAALVGALPADAEIEGAIEGVDAGRVAWAPQAPHAFAPTPRAELALYGASAEGLDEVGLGRVADAAVAELSPGELRRLAVARALARVDAGARLLVLDEPTAHLDPASADLVRRAVLRRAARCTVVLASHEPETLALATSRVVLAPAAAAVAAAADPASDAAAPDAAASAGRAWRVGSPATAQVRPLDHVDAPQRTGRLTLRALLRTRRWGWTAAILLAGLATGVGIALTAVSGWLIVRASVEEYITYLLVAIVGVRAFGIGRAAGRYAERLVAHRVTFQVVDALRLRLWRAIAQRGAGSRRLLEGGAPLDYLVTIANDLRDQLPRVLPPIGGGVLVAAGAIVTTGAVAPRLLLPVALIIVVAIALASALAVLSERGAGADRVRARSELVRGAAALTDAAADLRGNGVTDAALAELDAASARLADAERRAAWSAGGAAAVISLATAVLAVWASAAPATAAEFASVVALTALALGEPLVGLVAAVQRIPALRALLDALSPVLRPAPRAQWGDGTPDDVIEELALDDVEVRYPAAPGPAVSSVFGAVRRGGRLVLDGPSGSGKSTVLSAIMGALPVAAGEIRADAAPLPTLSEQSWRTRVAWCPQDAYVFDSTLRGNLLLARSREDAPDDDAMRAVLEQAGLGGLLASLPDGLGTRVGPGGSALSGGERQRLAVARALLTRADVILLDEPTAHLDEPTAAAMMADVRAATADRLVVLVSHRSADRLPDDVVVTLGGAVAPAASIVR